MRVWVKVEAPAGVTRPALQFAVWLSVSVNEAGGEHTAGDPGGGGVTWGGVLGGVTGGGVLGGGAIGVHTGNTAQQVGAGAEIQLNEQTWPGGVVPVAGAGAAPQPGAGGGGGVTGGGGGGGVVGGFNGGSRTGSNTVPARPVEPPW